MIKLLVVQLFVMHTRKGLFKESLELHMTYGNAVLKI